jgi:hypothetical protein
MKHLSPRIRATLALGAAAAATTIGLAATPAANASLGYIRPPVTVRPVQPPPPPTVGSMSEQLSVTRNTGSYYTVQVTGLINVSPNGGAAQLLNSGYRVTWKLWGSDPISDDFLFGPDPASVTVSPDGNAIQYTGLRVVQGSVLDEDDSFFDDHDELIAGASLLNASGTTVKSAQSNEVGGYF